MSEERLFREMSDDENKEPFMAWRKSDIEKMADDIADSHYRRYETRIIELEKKVWLLDRGLKSLIRSFKHMVGDLDFDL